MGLALGAGLAYAIYAVVVKNVVARLPPLLIAALTFGVAALVLLPALATERAPAGPATWALLAYLGIVPTALAYAGYVVGMRTTPVAVSAVLTLVEPLTATLLGVVFFGDRVGATGATGALLLLAAVVTLALQARPGSPGATSPSGRPRR